ncbi:6211_t:CDS:2, partial [Funneliformis caledonium]
MPRGKTKRPNNSRTSGVMNCQSTSSRNGMTTSHARGGMTRQITRFIKQSEDHEDDVYEDYNYKDYIDVDQDKDVQESFSSVTTRQTINQRILPTANANQVTNTTQENTQDSLSFPVTTYSRNRSIDKEFSSKHHNKRSHIDDLSKTLFEVFNDYSDIHQDSSNFVKQKFILCYKPLEQKESLSEIQPDLNKQIAQKDINEAKILFLRSRDSSTIAYDTLLKSIALGFSENSKTMSFLKMKLDLYFAVHRSRLNTEAKDDTDSVDVFRFFITTTIRIHIINVLKCNDDPHLTKISALNKVKTLNYIICEFHLPHNNSTNYANEIDANLLNNSLVKTKSMVVNVSVVVYVNMVEISEEIVDK